MTIDDLFSDKRSSRVGQLAAALAATGAVPVGVANGSLILQYEPTVGGGNTVIDLQLENNDPGAVYDSGTLSLLSPLANALYALPVNSDNNHSLWNGYNSVAELVADWNVSIRSPPTGQVHSGWNRTVNGDGSIDLANIGGIPDLSYTAWRDSINHPSQNTMALTVQIPLTQLELDGIAGYNPATDARIFLNPNKTVDNAFVANTGSPANGQAYSIVPEPTTSALLAVGLAGAYIARKVGQGKEAIKRKFSQ
jgi:hypothetical protein